MIKNVLCNYCASLLDEMSYMLMLINTKDLSRNMENLFPNHVTHTLLQSVNYSISKAFSHINDISRDTH